MSAEQQQPESEEPKKPKKPRKPPYWQRPEYIKGIMTSLNQRAADGNKEALARLEGLLARHPWLLDDVNGLTTDTLEAWLRRAAWNDPLRARAYQKEVEGLKAELLGEAPTAIERLLVDHVVISFVALKHAELYDSTAQGTEPTAAYKLKRLSACQKRFTTAMRWLLTVRGTMAKGFSPPKLKVFESRPSA